MSAGAFNPICDSQPNHEQIWDVYIIRTVGGIVDFFVLAARAKNEKDSAPQ